MLMAGIFVAGFVMDDKVKTPDDILKYSGLVTLAVIPALRANKPVKAGGPKNPSMPVGQIRGRG